MKRKNLETAKKMAKEAGFHDVIQLPDWKGHQVAEPVFTDGEEHCTGPIQYLLAKEGKVRWATPEESEEIIRLHYSRATDNEQTERK